MKKYTPTYMELAMRLRIAEANRDLFCRLMLDCIDDSTQNTDKMDEKLKEMRELIYKYEGR